jgi:hypothetical protein
MPSEPDADVVPLAPAPGFRAFAPTPPPDVRRTNWLAVAVGLAIVGVGGLVGVPAKKKFESVKKATAVVTVRRNVVGREMMGKDAMFTYVKEKYTEHTSASYTADGRAYDISPGLRAKNGDTFDVYYDPKNPADASQFRPVAGLALAAVIGLAGVAVTGLGFGVGGDYFTRRPGPPRRRRLAGPPREA